MQTTEQLILKLNESFQTAMASGAFTADEENIKKAIKALEIPDPEARFRKQFRNTAIRNLLSKASKEVNKGEALPYPTDDAIKAELERLLANWRAKKGITY